MLGKIRKFLTKQASVTILKSMVLPFFEYGGVFLEAAEPRYRDKLHRLFVRGIRIALNNFYPFVSEYYLHNEINLLPLCYRRRIMICKLMFKEFKKDNVLLVNNPYPTRLHDAAVMQVPDITNNKYKRFLPWLGPKLWNSLPSAVRNERDLTSFVRELKSEFRADFYFDEYFW